MHNPALDLAPLGRWTLRDETAQRQSAPRYGLHRRMRKISFLLAVLTFSLSARADGLPSELVGIWATEDSVFNGGALIGGTALYLSEGGKGALVGAPLPVGRCPDDRVCTPIIGMNVTAEFEENGGVLRIQIFEGGKTIPLEATFNAEKTVLTGEFGSSKNTRLVHRDTKLPIELKGMLYGNP